jgi:hypothetical protein
VYGWGSNDSGQLGDTSRSSYTTPIPLVCFNGGRALPTLMSSTRLCDAACLRVRVLHEQGSASSECLRASTTPRASTTRR